MNTWPIAKSVVQQHQEVKHPTCVCVAHRLQPPGHNSLLVSTLQFHLAIEKHSKRLQTKWKIQNNAMKSRVTTTVHRIMWRFLHSRAPRNRDMNSWEPMLATLQMQLLSCIWPMKALKIWQFQLGRREEWSLSPPQLQWGLRWKQNLKISLPEKESTPIWTKHKAYGCTKLATELLSVAAALKPNIPWSSEKNALLRFYF